MLDFGLAKALEARAVVRQRRLGQLADARRMPAPQAGVILGTAAYMAPEQARGKRWTSAPTSGPSACVLYEMLTGRPAVRRARRSRDVWRRS